MSLESYLNQTKFRYEIIMNALRFVKAFNIHLGMKINIHKSLFISFNQIISSTKAFSILTFAKVFFFEIR